MRTLNIGSTLVLVADMVDERIGRAAVVEASMAAVAMRLRSENFMIWFVVLIVECGVRGIFRNLEIEEK
jgi:hypothetical protein